MNTIAPGDRPRLLDDVRFIEKDGTLVFFNPLRPGGWFSGPPAAGTLLKMCDGVRTAQDVVDETEGTLGKEMGLSGDQWTATVAGLLNLAAEKGFFGGMEQTEYGFPLQMLWLHVTHACNLRCTYCYITGGRAMDDELSTAQILSLVDEFKELRDPEARQTIAVTGGEPLLREDIPDILRYIRSKDIDIVLATNGSLITEESIPVIKENVRLVHLSLDGGREAHDANRGRGSFEGAVRGLGLLRENDIPVYVQCVVTRENKDDVVDLASIAAENDLEEIRVTPLMPRGRGQSGSVPTAEDMLEVHRRLRQKAVELGIDVKITGEVSKDLSKSILASRFPCGAGVNAASIDADGTVYPCQAAHVPEFAEGSVRDEGGLTSVWSGSGAFSRWRDFRVEDMEDCTDCMWRRYCGGGCRLQGFILHGDLARHDLYCDVYKTSMEESLWWRERELRGDGN